MANIFTWMRGLEPNRKLVELCLPGSHDGGVYRDMRPFPGHTKVADPGPWARCQYENIWEQALCGSRVFDIRVFLRKEDPSDKTETPRETPTMAHFFKETTHGHLGDYGGMLMSALHDAALFLMWYDSEFIIFRVGHTKCTKEVADVLKYFREAPKHKDENSAYAKHRQSVIYTGATGNLANLEYQQLEGKLLLVFDNKFKDSPFGRKGPDNGYYRYEKYSNYPEVPGIGLSFCGEYAGGAEDKLRNQGNWSSVSADLLGRDGCRAHQGHKDKSNHLLWVYWQQTGGNILEKTTVDTADHVGMHTRLESFLKDVSTNSKLAMPNVIGHDFVTWETCASIVKLNPDLKDTIFTAPAPAFRHEKSTRSGGLGLS